MMQLKKDTSYQWQYLLETSSTETTTGSTIITSVTDGENVDPCGSSQPRLIDATSAGVVSSPNYPNYPNNAECSWLIVAGSQEALKLSFLEFETEE